MIYSQKDYNYIHSSIMKILQIVDNNLSCNNIFYTLACGTVLGAVREKGFIAWDLDADIFIKVCDKEAVRNILKSKFSDKYRYIDSSQDSVATHDQIIFEFNNSYYGLDIYPLIGFPESEKSIKKTILECRLKNKIYGAKYANISRARSFIKKAALVWLKLILFFVPNKLIRNDILKMENRHSFDNCKNISYIALDGRRGEVMPKNIIFETKRSFFEGEMLPIPCAYEEYLKNVYGDDYMTPRKY